MTIEQQRALPYDDREPVDARDLSCQGLANCDASFDPPAWYNGEYWQPVTGYAEKVARLGEGHIQSCDLMGHGIDEPRS